MKETAKSILIAATGVGIVIFLYDLCNLIGNTIRKSNELLHIPASKLKRFSEMDDEGFSALQNCISNEQSFYKSGKRYREKVDDLEKNMNELKKSLAKCSGMISFS